MPPIFFTFNFISKGKIQIRAYKKMRRSRNEAKKIKKERQNKEETKEKQNRSHASFIFLFVI